MRLIDADAIKLPKGFFEEVDNVPKFYEWLNEQPTIEERKTGRWIYGTDEETGEQDIVAWTCSLCGEKTPWQPRYCMHCGARMDGEQDGEL